MENTNIIDYKGYQIDIVQDDDEESNPRNWDNLGKMICFHQNYELGDKYQLNMDDFNNWNELRDYLIKELDSVVILPIRLYDHSGISISTTTEYPYNDVFDSGQVGFIFAAKQDILKEYSIKRISKKIIDKVRDMLILEVTIYNQYLTGDVWGYHLLKDDEEVFSCWGYFGYDECLKEAKKQAD